GFLPFFRGSPSKGEGDFDPEGVVVSKFSFGASPDASLSAWKSGQNIHPCKDCTCSIDSKTGVPSCFRACLRILTANLSSSGAFKIAISSADDIRLTHTSMDASSSSPVNSGVFGSAHFSKGTVTGRVT